MLQLFDTYAALFESWCVIRPFLQTWAIRSSGEIMMSKHAFLPRTIPLLLLIASLFAMVSPHAQLASPEAPPLGNQLDTGYSVIFDDGFDNGDTSHWNLPPGWIAAEEGGNWYLRATPYGSASLVSPLIRTGYRFRADLRIISGWAALHYRQSHGQYTLEVMPGWLHFSKFDGERWDEGIASGSALISADAWHTVEISGTLGHIQVLVDETLYLDYYLFTVILI